MSLDLARPSIFTTNDPSAAQLIDKLFQFVHCHIFTYQLGAHDYIRDDRGVFIDLDLAITMWTSAKLLAEGVNITPDVISYCHTQQFPLPSRLLTYNYARGPNPLLGAFNSQREAIAAVKECQEEGMRAVQWIVSIAQELMQTKGISCSELELRNRNLLEYYKCLTWPRYNEHGNTCHAVIPYQPQPRYSPPYSPYDPIIPHTPCISPTVPPNTPSSLGALEDFAFPTPMEVEQAFSGASVSSAIEQGGVGEEDSMRIDELLDKLMDVTH